MEFREVLKRVLELEGGLVLHRNRTERYETYAGIYRGVHKDWDGWEWIDRGEEPPFELVEGLYRREYWDKLDGLPERVRVVVFDMAVNMGIRGAVKVLQRVVGEVVDGVLGPKTLEAVRGVDEDILVRDLVLARIGFYVSLVERDVRRYGIYLRGWVKRSMEVLKWV